MDPTANQNASTSQNPGGPPPPPLGGVAPPLPPSPQAPSQTASAIQQVVTEPAQAQPGAAQPSTPPPPQQPNTPSAPPVPPPGPGGAGSGPASGGQTSVVAGGDKKRFSLPNIAFLKKKKTAVILLILLVGLGAALVAVQVRTRFFSEADQPIAPQKIKVSNISENSFTVSFTTEKSTKSFLAYGTSPALGQTATGETGVLHHIQVKNLKPATVYYYKIGVGEKQFDNNGSPYTVQTAPIATVPPTPDEMYGKVVSEAGSAVPGALVYVTIKDTDNQDSPGSSNLLSTKSGSDGTFSLDLGNTRTATLVQRFAYSRTADTISVEVEAGSSGRAKVTASTAQTQPFPDVKLSELGSLVDLSKQPLTAQQQESQSTRTTETQETATTAAQIETQLEATASATEAAQAAASAKPTVTLPANKTVDPGETITGKATPNTTLTITVRSSHPRTAQVATDANGNWSYTIPSDLEAGSHTITVAQPDGSSTEETFTVNVGPVGQSTSSAQATPSATPTATQVAQTPVAGIGLPTVFSLTAGTILILLGGLQYAYVRRRSQA